MAGMPGYRGHHSAAQLEMEALRCVEVLQRYQVGETLAAIAAHVDLTRERVRQIVKASGVAMPRAYKCAENLHDVAAHAERLLPPAS
jgi:peptidoglycan/xylan/chitin deacetylase (PgdA/CDA1 family)